MLGVLLDGISIILGGLIGIFFKRMIKDEQIESLFPIIGVVILVIGIQGAIQTDNMILVLFSLVFGSIIGVYFNLDQKIHNLGNHMKKLFSTSDENFTRGFITAFMVHSIGAMAILGPLSIGLSNDYSIMFTKASLDFASSIVFGSIYGAGALLSGPFTFLYEAIIFLLSRWIEPFLPNVVIGQISAVGSVLIIAMAINLLDIREKELKIPNYMPAIFIPVIWHIIANAFV